MQTRDHETDTEASRWSTLLDLYTNLPVSASTAEDTAGLTSLRAALLHHPRCEAGFLPAGDVVELR